jgi:hypothetical protein
MLPLKWSHRKEKAMIVILIILGLMLAAAAFVLTVHHYNRALPEPKAQPSLPPVPAGLFDDPEPEDRADPRKARAAKQRARLLELAAQRDLAALAEAHATGDVKVYDEILNAWIDAAARQDDLASLVTHIAKSNGLRANPRLAEQVMETWKRAPDQRSTVQMLHVAALADDMETYAKAVALTLAAWRDGQLAKVKPQALLALIESQYWVLATEARRGGAAFALKRQLAIARRELAAAATVR